MTFSARSLRITDDVLKVFKNNYYNVDEMFL